MILNQSELNQEYWNQKYVTNEVGWDIGVASPPIKAFVDTLENKTTSVLIPGCGNSYEAEYLLQQGFTNITLIDIAPVLVENLREKFKNNPNIKIILGDFFEHQGEYDLIIEQTFFCALPPGMRQSYVLKMHQLLAAKGMLVGLLFNKIFEDGPPFGGSEAEYKGLFKDYFDFIKMDLSQNSIAPRANSELFIEFIKRDLLKF